MLTWLHKYKFELLLIALLMVIFNRILFSSSEFYSRFIWPINMLFLGIVSVGIFHEQNKWRKWIKNMLFCIVSSVPFFASLVFQNNPLTFIAITSYLLFYGIIFFEVMTQITKKNEVTQSILVGSLSGFLLLIILATFSFLLLHHLQSPIFNQLEGTSIGEVYHQVVYFSCITLSTIGYGDITPITDNARLLAAFWGVVGQFYMVAIVGIIISKFTSKTQ